LLVAAAVASASAADGKKSPGATELANPLAVRLSNYGKFEDAAWEHVPSVGVHYLFMSVPSAGEVEGIKKRLAEHDLVALVLRGDTDLGRESSVDELAAQLKTCEKMGVRYMFLSPKHTGVGKEVAYDRLRQAGDIAKKHGVTIVLETHPDLGTNGDVHVETMRRINHPNVRINFDTGNITFYNTGLDAATELKKCIEYVATMEVKDHDGKLQSWNFPVLGTGVVDFPAVLKILEEYRFKGPITMEVEGFQGVVLDQAQTEKYIGDSAAYVQSLGKFAEAVAPFSKTIQGPDYVMLIGYFVLMLGIGLYFYRYMRGMKVYFTGGNKIPWWLSGVSFYMSSFSAYGFVIYSGLCFRFGWPGVTLFWVMVPATIISVTFFATRWRRARIDSPVEFLESRYSALVRQLFVWTGLPVGIIDDSLKLIATGTIVHVGMGFSLEASIIACGLIMLAYTFMGGLWAVTVTDFVQFVILAVAVVALFPLSIRQAGGFQSLYENAPDGFFSMTNADFNWYYIVLLIGLYAVAFSSTHWHLIQKYFCVPTEKDAKKVGWLVTVLFVIGPPLFFMPAIAAREFMPNTLYLLDLPGHDKEIYPQLCAYLLPVGMLGLIIAAMFSATMGNLSSHFNVRASVLTNDVYRRLIRPHAGEKELVTAGRGMTIIVGGLTILVAIFLAAASAEKLFKYMVSLFGGAVAPLGLPLIVGLVSRRVTPRSVVVAVIVGVVLAPILFGFPADSLVDKWPAFLRALLAPILLLRLPESATILGIIFDREVMMFAISFVTVMTIMFGMSAIWPMTAAESQRAELFHKRLETPIGGLPEDQAAVKHDEQAVSPFGIVGICVACIGILMLCVQPFIRSEEFLPMAMNVILGLVLVTIGLMMAWLSRRSSRRKSPLPSGEG
jgi:SSS family transporter